MPQVTNGEILVLGFFSLSAKLSGLLAYQQPDYT
jgi:hypothetical protein